MLVVRRPLLDRNEAGPRPATDRALVLEVRIGGHLGPAGGEQRERGKSPRGIRPEPSATSLRHEEHVEPAATRLARLPPGLDEPDRLAGRLDDPRVDGLVAQRLDDLVARERLVVPVARDLGVGVPRDEQLGVGLLGASQLGQSPHAHSFPQRAEISEILDLRLAGCPSYSADPAGHGARVGRSPAEQLHVRQRERVGW